MTVVHPNHIVGINSITVQTGDSLSVHKADGSLIRTIVSNTGVSTFHAIEVSKGGGDLTVGISTLVVDNSAGKIGIGTVPARTLQVFAATPQVNLKSASGGTCELQFGDTGDEVRANIIYNSTDNYLGFNGYNNTERFRILSNGRIGINTSEATSALQIYAADLGEGTAKGQIVLKDTAAYNASPQSGIVFQGHHASNNSQAIWSGIRGFKANAADGDYDGCLGFDVRKHGDVAYEAMRINEDAKTFIHATNATSANNTATLLPNGNTLNIHGTSSVDGISVVRYSADYGAYGINIGKSNNSTFGTNTLVTDGEELGHVSFYGADGTDFNMAAQITGLVDGTPSDGTDMPGALVFKTSAEASDSPTEKLRITSTGNTRITKANDGVVSGALQINTTLANYGTIVVRDYNQANIGALQVENNTSGAGQNNKVIRSVDLGSSNWAHAGYHALSHKFRISGETDSNNVLQIHSTGISPGADGTLNLGSPSARWANIYSADLQLSNEGSENEIDGSWGSYTIQEGETDLFLINRRNGKKYTFNLTEVS